MFETATSRRHYDAIRAAHAERSAAFTGFFSSLLGRRS